MTNRGLIENAIGVKPNVEVLRLLWLHCESTCLSANGEVLKKYLSHSKPKPSLHEEDAFFDGLSGASQVHGDTAES
jgi:hypothetical protein